MDDESISRARANALGATRPSTAAMRRTPEGYFTVRWGQPEYTDWIDESMSWKESCYIGDWSFLWERRFRGPDVLRLFSDLSVNSFGKFEIGQAKHVIHCDEAGKIIHEGILSRLEEDEFMLFGRGGFWVDYKLRRGRYRAVSEPDDWFNFQVSGPNALHVVEKAASHSIRNIRFMHSGRIYIAGHEVWALRQGMAGELGYELQGPAAHAREVYEAILEAGRDFGIRRLGGRAAFINHLEACFPTIVTDYLPAIFSESMAEYLVEFKVAMPSYAATFNIAGSFESDDISAYYRSPIELGWANRVKFDHDFIGSAALEKELKDPQRTICTLVWNADDVVEVYASLFRAGEPYHYMEIPRDQRGFMYADKVMKNGKLAGVATSRGYSYYFRQMLSLCVIDPRWSEPGTEVTVIWGEPGELQKEIRATVAPAPYKKDNRRVNVQNL
jgi:vanillate/3-O-methylgallate O-demethylase